MPFRDLDDLFEELFMGRRRGPRPGSNMEYRMRITFMEAVHGCKKDIAFQVQQQRPDGRRSVSSREVQVTVPAGVETGMTVKMPGQGSDGDRGMPRGDLYVQLIVDEDRYFKRDEQRPEDVHVEVPITVSQAVLGATIDVLTLDGMVELKVPAGAQPSSRLLMRGKGIQRVQTPGRGNQIVHLKLEVPLDLTPRQRELMKEFAVEESRTPSGQSFSDLVNRTFGRLRAFWGKSADGGGTGAA